MQPLNKKLKDSSSQVNALSLQVEVLKRENKSLKEDCKKKDDHLKLLNTLAISNVRSRYLLVVFIDLRLNVSILICRRSLRH